MSYSDTIEDRRTRIETDRFIITISEPRGDWETDHLQVSARFEYSSPMIIECDLTESNIRALCSGNGGPATSAAVYGLIRDAALDHGINERFERVANEEA